MRLFVSFSYEIRRYTRNNGIIIMKYSNLYSRFEPLLKNKGHQHNNYHQDLLWLCLLTGTYSWLHLAIPVCICVIQDRKNLKFWRNNHNHQMSHIRHLCSKQLRICNLTVKKCHKFISSKLFFNSCFDTCIRNKLNKFEFWNFLLQPFLLESCDWIWLCKDFSPSSATHVV